ncbi:Na+/H+ antiporter NhaC family protein [Fervidobacterium islandicum]|uniref:Na+/H+ antiporter NhaC family protein n=1 Tax=Fervidobacterium islandicum TaxID=2423 RepID=A0AAJ5I5S1_FERIS|nr:Na+/H+ antiporter NhaC family protein [Fervidobacterium islandicum]UOE96871.1 Na+/H+ antiporter NhaC family protein [Fervidobacterium islandicum]
MSFKLKDISETFKTIVDGFKLMLLACTILVLAWSIGSVTKDVDLSGFVVSSIKEGTSFSLVPGIIFIVGALISFATGTSWGTMAILTPIAIPIAYKLTGDSWLSVTVMSGAVFAGSIFGDHCSPISDTTVLSSIFASCDHMDHVNTQLPYAVFTAFVSLIMFILYGFFKISPFVLIFIGLVLIIALARVLHVYSLRRYQFSEKTYAGS